MSLLLSPANTLLASLLFADAAVPPPIVCPPDKLPRSSTDECGTSFYCGSLHGTSLETVEGPVVELYPSGAKRVEYELSNIGRRVGPFTKWHRNGVRRMVGQYTSHYASTDTPFDGLVTEWYSNGRKHAEATFHGGRAEGLARLWSPAGQLRIEATWDDGRPHGKWRSFFANGKPEIDLTVKKGYLNGPVILWAVNGQKIEEFSQFFDGKEGLRRKWTEHGQLLLEEHTLKGTLDGAFKEFFPSGQRKTEATYKGGEFTGPSIEWFESGQTKSSGNYLVGKRQGAWKTWHANGQLESETVYEGGEEQPGWSRYFPDGRPSERLGSDGKYEQFSADGTRLCTGMKGPKGRTGQWVWYDEQGRKEKAGTYSDNWPDGEFLWFDTNGSVLVKDVFRKGVLASIRCPKGTRRSDSPNFGSIRKVSCRDSKGHEHGMTYLFSQYADGEYVTRTYVHGEARLHCPEGVDPRYCAGTYSHPPFAVLQRKRIKFDPEGASGQDEERPSQLAPEAKAMDLNARSCDGEDGNSLETMSAFWPFGIEVWRPTALTSPERLPDSK